ncbi:hypothetical protein GN244_ATG00598 [Phytophthora infestans]|uniref:Uncharacterized protein n=1 Tax=Phytophthora infestans TaxID=4787 RepID=A0A833THE0_PHYIN|nr:hypothetical protein GN244_ATG00598 [Phytophthora infestans]KAF4127249.1 hypothetical protein GN958_ATG23563 [Phytophthora infestans]
MANLTNVRCIRILLVIVIGIMLGVSNGFTANHAISDISMAESDLFHGATNTNHVATRELSGHESDEDRRGGGRGGGGRGGGGGGRGGRGTSTRGTGRRNYYYYGGGNPSIGLWNTNGVTRHKEKKCNRFTNWFKRLFNKSIPKCPKKKEKEMRHLRG